MIAHEFDPSPARVLRRALALLVGVLALVAVTVPAARATEEVPAAPADEQRLTYEQLREQASPRAQEFFPDAYEEPSFFQWISLPVLLGGLFIAIVLLGAYLWWQPKFAAERRQKQRR